jgi:succinyl-diaminopimelate desuccinylase
LSGEPFLTATGRLTEAISQVIKEETGLDTELSTGGGTSDGRFISPAGTDVIELGPVNASIHKVNEHIKLADLPRLTTMYQRIMELLLT